MLSMKNFFSEIPKPYSFTLKNGTQATVEFVKDPQQIDQQLARTLLVESFIKEYSAYLQPNEIDAKLNSWREGDLSVQKYYEDYFKSEFTKFNNGEIPFWVEVKIDGKLIGWGTFEKEPNKPNEIYMDLICVDPNYQKQGIGTQIVMSLINLKEMPNLAGINILLRKKNQGGRTFYESLGFKDNPEYKRDDFVDTTLLTGISWLNPKLENRNELPFGN